ncbi:hypothetical protein [Muribaculum intestinale]|uniref:hypothetical protein n=1 Tax=Muribaculum intestinale TaxID=1796646 RepID=UPI002430F960|nr:hypothetical protein [Muribaculum intestinale]
MGLPRAGASEWLRECGLCDAMWGWQLGMSAIMINFAVAMAGWLSWQPDKV